MCRTENLYFGTLCKCHPDRRTNCFLSLESSLCPFMSSTHQISTRFLHTNLRTPPLPISAQLRPQAVAGVSFAPRALHLPSGTTSQALRTTPTQPPLEPSSSPFSCVSAHFLSEPSLPLSPVRRAQRVPATVSQPPVLSATRLWPPTRCSTESQDPPLGGRCWEAAAWTEPTHCSGTSENRERGLKPCSRPAARRRKSSVSNPHRPGQPAGRLQRRAQPPHLSSHWSARRQRALGRTARGAGSTVATHVRRDGRIQQASYRPGLKWKVVYK